MTRAEKICKALEDLWMCCEEIRNTSCCGDCPLKYTCLMDTPLVEVADLLSSKSIDEFIEYAEMV